MTKKSLSNVILPKIKIAKYADISHRSALENSIFQRIRNSKKYAKKTLEIRPTKNPPKNNKISRKNSKLT